MKAIQHRYELLEAVPMNDVANVSMNGMTPVAVCELVASLKRCASKAFDVAKDASLERRNAYVVDKDVMDELIKSLDDLASICMRGLD